jgi:beta-N-acetylhexosaminidase
MKIQLRITAFLAIFFSIYLIGCETKTTENQQQTQTSIEPTLDEKIGQMLMIGFRGAALSDDNHIVKDIKNLNIGGVVL